MYKNHFALNRREAIILINRDPAHWRAQVLHVCILLRLGLGLEMSYSVCWSSATYINDIHL